MRHGRAKAARKTLQYFQRTCGLKAPFSILVDATFVAALFQQKILPVKERLDKILQSSPTQPNKYFIGDSAVEELRKIHAGLEARNHEKVDAFSKALEWVRKECIVLKDTKEQAKGETSGHKKNKLSNRTQEDFIRNLEQSETPFVVASQDEELLDHMRHMGTVPIVRLANHTVLILENPSKSSQLQTVGAEKEKWRHSLPEAEKALVEFVKTQTTGDIKIGAPQTRPRAKKAKGPNPLSCKRKQKTIEGNNEEPSSKKRRRRD
jgi:U3 small nucleolar RNA-associated protein 23